MKRPKGGKLSHHQREWRKGFAMVGVDIVYLNTMDEVNDWIGKII